MPNGTALCTIARNCQLPSEDAELLKHSTEDKGLGFRVDGIFSFLPFEA